MSDRPSSRPIGVLDSGVGGLSVLREIRRALPGEDLIYVADSAYSPYGDRDERLIARRVDHIAAFLQGLRAKAIVVACNTATGVAVDELRRRLSVPVVAIEPAVKPAVALTRSRKVGVLATTRTLSSARFSRLVDTFAAGVEVIPRPCPGLVELIEAGEFRSEATRTLIGNVVAPLRKAGVDTIVLGCTHYPFVSDVIQEAVGRDVTIIDPSAAVARELKRRLDMAHLSAPEVAGGSEAFYTTGDVAHVERVIRHIWGTDVSVQAMERWRRWVRAALASIDLRAPRGSVSPHNATLE